MGDVGPCDDHPGDSSSDDDEVSVPPSIFAPPINPYPQSSAPAKPADPDLFSPQKWRRVATSSLLQATKAVDQLCHAVVATKPSVSSDPLASEIRRLALTVAVFERSLFAYALRIKRASQLTVALDEPPVLEAPSPSAASSASEHPHKPVFRPSSGVGWKKAGMVSLLQMLTRTLNGTTALLNSITHENSFVKYVRSTRAWLILPILLLLRRKLGEQAQVFCRGVATRFPGLEPFIKLVERFALTRYGLIPLTLYCLYLRAISNRCNKLKQLHSRLNILLTLWHICVSVIDQEEVGDTYGDQVAISQWMLELVPPSLDFSFWYQSTWQLSLVKYGMDVVYSSVSQWYNIFGDRIIGYPFLCSWFLYYGLRPGAAARKCSTLLGSPDIRFISTAWKTHDAYLMPRLLWWYHAYVRPFLRLSPRLVTREILLTHDYPNCEAEMLRRQTNRKLTIKVMLLSGKVLDLCINTKLRTSAVPPARNVRIPSSPVIIYLHGGGWLHDFRFCTLPYLKRWAIKTGAPILYVDYTMATESAYPAALEECYEVFKWVADGRLGIHPSSIILAGDSTGGHLAAGVCLKSILNDDPIRPGGLLLAYPILNLKLTPTPSRTLFMMDALLPMNLLLQCRSMYCSNCDASSDPCLSPLMASDHLLAQFPPTSIMVGGFDPFLDDSIDFAHRLHTNGIQCRLKVFPRLPHCFLFFSSILPDARYAVDLGARWLKSGLTPEQVEDEDDIPRPILSLSGNDM